MSAQNSQPQFFEIDEADSAHSSEQSVLGVAKIACLALVGASLTFGAIDIASSAGDASALWHLKLRPALAAAIAGSDAEIQSRGAATAIVKANFNLAPAKPGMAFTAPYVLPETPAAKPVAKLDGAKPETRTASRAMADEKPAAPKRVRVEPMVFASASPDDLRLAPPLASSVSPADVTMKLQTPAVASVGESGPVPVSPLDVTPPFPTLSAVPLPRPSPHREEDSHDPTPAELLGLDINPKERAKAERCLANAVYFESRSEPVRGQVAVAQVVMNRVFSPFYPKDVCSVVYQNAGRHLSCQFTFACDGKSKAIHDRGSWARASRIAKQTLDGKLWINEVAKSTHYHAQYVRPNWVGEMRRLFKTGLHMFYRPYNWGDGSDEQGWVKATQTASVDPVATKKKHR